MQSPVDILNKVVFLKSIFSFIQMTLVILGLLYLFG